MSRGGSGRFRMIPQATWMVQANHARRIRAIAGGTVRGSLTPLRSDSAEHSLLRSRTYRRVFVAERLAPPVRPDALAPFSGLSLRFLSPDPVAPFAVVGLEPSGEVSIAPFRSM